MKVWIPKPPDEAGMSEEAIRQLRWINRKPRRFVILEECEEWCADRVTETGLQFTPEEIEA
jgi:hypothetical protein